MANGLKNVPHLTSALKSSDLEVDSEYKTFIDVAKNPADDHVAGQPANGAAYLDDLRAS